MLTDCEQGCGLKLSKAALQQHSCIATLKDRIEELMVANKKCNEELMDANNSLKQRDNQLENKIRRFTDSQQDLGRQIDNLKIIIFGVLDFLADMATKLDNNRPR